MRTNQITWSIFKLLWVMLLLVFPFQVQSQSEQLKIVTAEEPPMSFLENQEVTGIVTDIVKEILKRTESKTPIKLYPWVRSYQICLREPNVVLFTAARTEARETLFHWIGPVIEKRWVLISKRGSNIEINRLEDVSKAMMVGVVRGDARAKLLLENGVEVYLLNTLQQGFIMLMNGRVDLVATADVEIPIVATKIGYKSRDFRIVYTLEKIHSYIVISKDTQLPIVRRWRVEFEGLKKDGTFAKIVNKWAKILETPLTGERGIIEIQALK